MVADVEQLRQRYKTLQLDVRQLEYEDTVDEDRNAGLHAMMQRKDEQQALEAELGETEAYTKTLSHMLRRSEDEKLAELSQLKAFEDALTVHRQEMEMAQDMQRQVNKARDEEVRALQKLHVDLRAAIANLDKKLEGRRLEVKVRQEKARYRLIKLADEMALKSAAEGILSPEQELAMVEKARANAIEHDMLRMEKLTVLAEADQLEAEFSALRFAAGGQGGMGGADGLAKDGKKEEEENFVRPDPEPIVSRLAQLEEELASIGETLQENVALLAIQQQQKGVLTVIKQPRATDPLDEVDKEVDAIDRLQARADAAKRTQEASQRDLETMRGLKLHLEQSLGSLAQRISAMPLIKEDFSSGNTPSERAFERAVGELGVAVEKIPTQWARTQTGVALDLMRKLHKVCKAVDGPAAAQGAMAASDAWERSEIGAAAVLVRPAQVELAPLTSAREASPEEDMTPEEIAAKEAAEREADALEEARQVESDKLIEATIESLVVQNEFSVRVRPGSSGPSRPFNSINAKSMTEAVAAFERTWRGAAGAPADKEGAFFFSLTLPSWVCAFACFFWGGGGVKRKVGMLAGSPFFYSLHSPPVSFSFLSLFLQRLSTQKQTPLAKRQLLRCARICLQKSRGPMQQQPPTQASRTELQRFVVFAAAAAHPPPTHTPIPLPLQTLTPLPRPPLMLPCSPRFLRLPLTHLCALVLGTFSGTLRWRLPWWVMSWMRAPSFPLASLQTRGARRLQRKQIRCTTCGTRSRARLRQGPKLWLQRRQRRQP